MRPVNMYATRTALTEWAGQSYVNNDNDGVSLIPRIESFGANTRLAITVVRLGRVLSTLYAYATAAVRNADTGRDINAGSIVYGEANGSLAFWSGSAWTVDTFSVATALRAALSAFAASLVVLDGIPIPGPPGTTDFDDLTAVPEFISLLSDPVGAAAALEFALETAMPNVLGARVLKTEIASPPQIFSMTLGQTDKTISGTAWRVDLNGVPLIPDQLQSGNPDTGDWYQAGTTIRLNEALSQRDALPSVLAVYTL